MSTWTYVYEMVLNMQLKLPEKYRCIESIFWLKQIFIWAYIFSHKKSEQVNFWVGKFH